MTKYYFSFLMLLFKKKFPVPKSLYQYIPFFGIPFRRGVLATALCDKVCQWLAACQGFSPGIPVSSTNKTDSHDITEILLKVALNTITLECIHEHFINYFKRTEEIVTLEDHYHQTINYNFNQKIHCFMPLSTIFLLDFGIVLIVYYFFFLF
jgi:hypothetical protein